MVNFKVAIRTSLIAHYDRIKQVKNKKLTETGTEQVGRVKMFTRIKVMVKLIQTIVQTRV